MPDFSEFLPVVSESVATIRARIEADTNIGIDPSSPEWQDTAEGSFHWDMTQGAIIEMDRLWDALGTEIPAATFVAFSYGEYLDAHGVDLNVPRKAAVKAAGEVTFTGTPGTLIPTGVQVGTAQTDPDVEPPTFVTTQSGTIPVGGSITLEVEAQNEGTEGNVAAAAIDQLLTGLDGIASLTNAVAITGGADVESDERYQARLMLEFSLSHGSGTVADYMRWGLQEPGVGFVTVEPLWNGPGTVRVIITNESNDPTTAGVVTSLQTRLDPVAGQGQGLAPVGAIVTVATPASVVVNVASDLTLSDGYTLDGTGGTVAVRAEIEAAVKDYLDTLPPGEDVVLEHVKSRFFAVTGVYDVGVTTLNGVGSNVAIGALQVAAAGTVTLT